MDLKENKLLSTHFTRHPWESARADIAWSLLKGKLIKDSGKSIQILDIGSGDLYQAIKLVKKRNDIVITALDSEYDQDIKNEFLKEAGTSNIELIQSFNELDNEKPFSAVLMMDVLEHVENDKAFLKDVVSKEIINEDTILLITVPAFHYLYSKHDTFLGHFRRYNRKKLLSLCHDAGIEEVSSGYFFLGLWLARLLQFAFNKLFGIKKGDYSDLGPWYKPNWMASLIKYCLLFDFHFGRMIRKIGIHLPGLSTYMIGRKK